MCASKNELESGSPAPKCRLKNATVFGLRKCATNGFDILGQFCLLCCEFQLLSAHTRFLRVFFRSRTTDSFTLSKRKLMPSIAHLKLRSKIEAAKCSD